MTFAATPTLHLGVGWRATQYPLLYEGIPVRHSLAIEGALRWPVGLEVGVTGRVVAPATEEPSWAVEAGLHVDGVATIGRWRPAAGLELGGSTRTRSEVLDDERPPGSYFAYLGTPEPVWLDFTATPARFALGAYELGAARLGVGISLIHPGMVGRWSVDVLTVSRSF